MIALCIHCGNIKQRPSGKCVLCSFQPKTDEEKAKSLILSVFYEIDDDYKGFSSEQLRAISTSIRSGIQHVFDEKEIRSVIDYANSVLDIPAKRLVSDGLRWLAPPILLLSLLLIPGTLNSGDTIKFREIPGTLYLTRSSRPVTDCPR
jgi:hypothetical protein